MTADSQIKTISNEEIEHQNELEMIPIKKSRSKHLDFFIICKNKEGKKVRYGLERSVLANTSNLFECMFDVCTEKQKPEIELVDFDASVVLSFLNIMHGIIDRSIWTVDHSSDVIDIGHKYGCDAVVVAGINYFYRSFMKLTMRGDTLGIKGSRFGKGALLKYISLWRRGAEDELCWTYDQFQSFAWSIEILAPKWFKICGLDIQTSSPIQLLDKDHAKYFTGEDIVIFCQYFQRYEEIWHEKSLLKFLEGLKREKAEEEEGSEEMVLVT